MNKVLKVLIVGGVVYVLIRYLFPHLREKGSVDTNFPNDGRTTFWGEDGVSYVRGFLMPNNIDDFQINEPTLIIKPDEYVFGEKPRSSIKVKLDREKKKIQYIPENNPKKIYVADYSELKDKLVMLNNDIKK